MISSLFPVNGQLKYFKSTQTLVTTGSPGDLGSVSIPATVTRWRLFQAVAKAATASGTLAAATVGLYTQAAAAGTNIVAPVALASLTAANTIQSLTAIFPASGISDTNVFFRQTVDSGNAGTVTFYLIIQDLS